MQLSQNESPEVLPECLPRWPHTGVNFVSRFSHLAPHDPRGINHRLFEHRHFQRIVGFRPRAPYNGLIRSASRKPGMSAPYQILISNEQSSVAISADELRRVATLTLQCEGVVSAEISLAVVDDPAIHKVNREYLEHDYPTDVISFLLDSGEADPLAVLPDNVQSRRGAGRWLHGDVILSAQTAQREAADYGWEPQSEICLYLVHGLLHLCGYDDLTDEEQVIMRTREREILQQLGLSPRYEED
jgi:probable rRNA maturation factor